MRVFVILVIVFGLLLTGCANQGAPAPTGQPPTDSAYIENKGSDTIVNLALAWAENYQKLHPQTRISVTGGGSGTGITALINGTVDIANASRGMKAEERDTLVAKGNDPQEYIIARDAIAIIVNPANPVDQLTLAQLSAIYRGDITNWSELGGEDREIVRLSRETNSGTHVYFLESVVRMGSSDDKTIFSANTLLLPSSEGIISEVKENPNAIGYDSLGYVTDEVKLIAVSSLQNPDEFILPSIATVNNNTYLISRNLYMYTANPPTGAEKDYLDWILSPQAQEIARGLGFIPVIIDEVSP